MVTLAENRRARFDYEILETYEAGIELFGHEVKSVRAGRASFLGAFVVIRGREAFLLNANIPPYQQKNTPPGYDSARSRRLLLHRKEIETLIGASATRGLTLIPIRMYNKGPRIKLEIGLARRRKKHDKRERIREREEQQVVNRALKGT